MGHFPLLVIPTMMIRGNALTTGSIVINTGKNWITASTKKNTLATLLNCSDRFFGINRRSEYLEVRIAFEGYFWGSEGGGRFPYNVRGAGSSVSAVIGCPFLVLRNTGSHERGMSAGHPESEVFIVFGSTASEVALLVEANGLRAACARSVDVILGGNKSREGKEWNSWVETRRG
jgi:hypothetical protein